MRIHFREDVMWQRLPMLLATVWALAAAAPRPALSQLWWGVEGGYRRSTISVTPDDGADYGGKADVHAGVLLRKDFAGALAVRLGALYTRKGSNASIDLFGTPLSVSLDLAYVEVPVLGVLRLPGRTGGTRPFLTAGPVVGFRVHCGIRLSAGGLSQASTCADDGDDASLNMAPFELGAALGAGVEVPAGWSSFVVELGYDRGLTDIDRDPSYRVQNRGLTASLAVLMPLGARHH